MKVLCLLFLSALFYTPFLYQKITLGFHPSKLEQKLSFCSEWEWPAAPSTKIDSILDQPFFYLARGSQSYVFSSQDGRYVLKIFRYNRSQFPWLQKVKAWSQHNLGRREKAPLLAKLDKTFRAYAMALAKVPEETGVLYIHFNKAASLRQCVLALKGPLGRTWRLPADAYRFIVQKKAEPFKATLLAAASQREEMEKRIDSFLDLLQKRSSQQIRNSDPNLGPNFGFCEGRAIEIDCGNYRFQPSLADPALQKEEIERFARALQEWLERVAPEYAPYVKEGLEKRAISLNLSQ